MYMKTCTWKTFLFLRFKPISIKAITSSTYSVTLSLPEQIMKTCYVVLTFESVIEILWCDHSNETSSAVLLHGTICFLTLY